MRRLYAASDDDGLLERLREDRAAVGRSWKVYASPGFQAVAVHRMARFLAVLPTPARAVLAAPVALLAYLVRTLYQVEVPVTAEIGRRLVIEHQTGVVIGPHVRVGDDCRIAHNTTIGQGDPPGVAPVLGNGVDVGTGAVIEGRLTIGDGARVGPNAIVARDVGPGVVVTAPASIIRQRRPAADSRPANGPSAGGGVRLGEEGHDRDE